MFQTSYAGLKPLHTNNAYRGGFCQFWYIAKENIAVFPRINAANQQLVDEPLLVAGSAWMGPIVVPNNELGFTEAFKRTRAGHYYEHRVEGLHLGDSVESRVNLENMAYHKYLVVGKVRAGGFYLLIGTPDSPLTWEPQFSSGKGAGNTAQTTFSFSTEHINKAYILPSFVGATQNPLEGGSGSGGSSTMNNKEIIPFVNQPVINIPWTPARQSKFGNFPVIEVWLDDGENPPFLNNGGSIEVDAPPPAFTELNVRLGGNPSGFIVIT